MTIKQEKAIANVLENNGNVSRAMIDAGYSPATAKNPSMLTTSKTWEKLMKKHLPDKHLGKRHREFLDAPRIVRTFKKGDLETEITETDPSAVKALDMAYKLKRRYSEAGEGNTFNTVMFMVPPEILNKHGIPSNTENRSQ